MTGNPAFAGAAAPAGFTGMDTVRGFAATLFALLALPAGAFTAVRMGASATAETDRHLTGPAAQPVSRTRLLGAETAVTGAGALLLLGVAALAFWAGAVVSGGGPALSDALAGAVNTLPVVALSLGAATLALGAAPRLTGLAGTLPGTGGFLLQVLADGTGAPPWVREMSPFAHLAPVPLSDVAWPAAAVMTGVAIVLTMVGTVAYRHRDLHL